MGDPAVGPTLDVPVWEVAEVAEVGGWGWLRIGRRGRVRRVDVGLTEVAPASPDRRDGVDSALRRPRERGKSKCTR